MLLTYTLHTVIVGGRTSASGLYLKLGHRVANLSTKDTD